MATSNPILLNNVDEDTTGDIQVFSVPLTLYCAADNYGGGEVSIQVSHREDGTFHTIHTFSADGVRNIEIFGKYYIRAVLAGATGPSNVLVAAG